MIFGFGVLLFKVSKLLDLIQGFQLEQVDDLIGPLLALDVLALPLPSLLLLHLNEPALHHDHPLQALYLRPLLLTDHHQVKLIGHPRLS